MKASIQQRLEYVSQQLMNARAGLNAVAKYAEIPEARGIAQSLEKVVRVLNGADVPTDNRGRIDLAAPVADPLED